MTSTQPRIFVLIASYRDPECHHTIRDLLEKAAHPDRVFVGVCWQYDPKEDADYLRVPYPRVEQVRVVQFHARDAQGAGWARTEAMKLWQGEDYVLQIQAHHRFEPGWDETLIRLLAECPSNKPVLTGWLPGYRPPDSREACHESLPLAVVNRIGAGDDAQMVHLIKRMMPTADLGGKVLPTPFWVGNFMFTRAQTLHDVPFDPMIYFWGEELNYSARLWTHGYDLFHLNQCVLYHYWDREGVKDEAMYRSFADERNRRSLARNRHLLRLESSNDTHALTSIDRYDLGTVRSLESFWQFAGVDLARRKIANHARSGKWPLPAQPTRPASIYVAIASHRDPEISATLTDMFAKAALPDRLRVGICLQINPAQDGDCDVQSDRLSQMIITRIHPDDSFGANWARAKALGALGDEDYVLMIDSHMRFAQGWDEALIAMLARCPAEKPLISAYLPNYDPPDRRDLASGLLRIRIRRFGQEGDPQLIHISGQRLPPDDTERTGLYPSPFVVCNFMFARAQMLRDVPVDPHFHFYGDELSYSARLWSHGYDVFQPDRVVAFHYWVRKDRLTLQHYRTITSAPNQQARQRGMHLLGLQRCEATEPLAEIARYGLGSARTLEDFWTFGGIDWVQRKLQPDALEGKWPMAPQKKTRSSASKAKKAADMEAPQAAPARIFVQIASYRDPDCQYTVKDLFEKAAHPERIFVGICWQRVQGEDDHCFQVPYPRPQQVRVLDVDARKSRGVCWARSQTQTLWQGEEFTLQIDSHMRFEPRWDETLLTMWAQCDNPKAVLTCYPPGFTPPDDCKKDFVFGMSAKEFDKHGILLMKGAPAYKTSQLPKKPMQGAFLSGCMYFGSASLIRDVPYDPHLYFFGEEISYGVRLWTHGYDLFHPNQLVVYHDWDRSKRPTHFSDHRDWSSHNKRAFARVKHLLGTERSSDPKVLDEIDRFGLGTVRSLADYQVYAGVDFAAKTFTANAARGEFGAAAPAVKAWAGKPRIFVQIASYRDPECQWTVRDLFEKATHPERITVAICWQFDPAEDADCFQISTRPEQVKVLPYDWRESDGVCWARRQTQLLWEGEEYSLQIDAHMRFIPGWDEAMIAELAACPSAKPVLSCSPASYIPPNQLEKNPHPTVRRVTPFFADGNIRGRGEALHRTPHQPLNGAFIAAGFVFARSEIIEEVPYDPYLYFDQEEIAYAARLYTHGWDVFSTRRPLLYHYYNTGNQNRRMHWDDLRRSDEQKIRMLKSHGLSRLNHLTGYQQSRDPEVIREIGFYGFGDARSLQQFEVYCGIDFKKKIASERALRAEFIDGLAQYRDGGIHVPELDGAGGKTAEKAMVIQAPRPALREVSMLEAGDFLPMFTMVDHHHKSHNLEVHGGKLGLLVYLSRDKPQEAVDFLNALHEQLSRAAREDIWLIFVMDETPDFLAGFVKEHQLPQVLTADPDRMIARALGLVRQERQLPPVIGYVVNRNLRVQRRIGGGAPTELAQQLMQMMRDALALDRREADDRLIRRQAPALIVPEVFSPDFCRYCIEVFRSGKTFDGTVGAEERLAYLPEVKVRSDYVVYGELLRDIDDKLSRSLFPEIRKVFGFEVTHREFYKIGMYSGEKQGFFKQHRDNYDAPVGYRRVAMTLHLSDDYEGGGLRFPEYDQSVYRPELGSAIIFSCDTKHEALKVTRGERFVVVGFFHGREDEAFRHYYRASKDAPIKEEDFVAAVRPLPPELELARQFYTDWQQKAAKASPASPATSEAPRQHSSTPAPTLMVRQERHQPKKVFESNQAVIYDDFLPEALYQKLYDHAVKTDYEHINLNGKVTRAWHVHDGFPLRSLMNLFYYPPGVQKKKSDFVYPTQTDMDQFIDYLLAMQPHVEHFVGKMGEDWSHLTATNWIYPHGTGLSLHDDGSGVYTGAYAYFLNPVWKLHWGGLNLMMGDEGNKLVYDYRNRQNQKDFYDRKWLNANNIDALLMEQGLAQCIFPKKNRIVFIASNAYHMVTRVNEQCGDNLRMSIAGFYNRKK